MSHNFAGFPVVKACFLWNFQGSISQKLLPCLAVFACYKGGGGGGGWLGGGLGGWGWGVWVVKKENS